MLPVVRGTELLHSAAQIKDFFNSAVITRESIRAGSNAEILQRNIPSQAGIVRDHFKNCTAGFGVMRRPPGDN